MRASLADGRNFTEQWYAAGIGEWGSHGFSVNLFSAFPCRPGTLLEVLLRWHASIISGKLAIALRGVDAVSAVRLVSAAG